MKKSTIRRITFTSLAAGVVFGYVVRKYKMINDELNYEEYEDDNYPFLEDNSNVDGERKYYLIHKVLKKKEK